MRGGAEIRDGTRGEGGDWAGGGHQGRERRWGQGCHGGQKRASREEEEEGDGLPEGCKVSWGWKVCIHAWRGQPCMVVLGRVCLG